MGEAEIVTKVREWQAGLLNREEEQFRLMARAWMDIEKRLEGQMSALALEIEQARQAGKVVTLEQIRLTDRYQRLAAEARVEVAKYELQAGMQIVAAQKEMVAAGWDNAVKAVQLARPGDWREFISVKAARSVENMVGYAADGSPLATLLKAASGDSQAGMNRALIEAMALGWNPVKTARAMADGLAGGLDRALLIARTEQMRVLRESTRMGYQTSGIVLRYKRIAAISDRTCIACLLADGTIYDVASDFEEHPAGRCGLVPIITGLDEPTWRTGTDWLIAQDAAVQQERMGLPAWNAWKSGQISLGDLVTRHEDAVWGSYLKPTPLRDLPLA